MADYWKADRETMDLMLELVGQYHPDLAEVSEEGIAVVFREKATKAAPFGTSRLVSALYDALIPDELVFIIELPADVWTESDPRVRKAMLDARLCACGCELDESNEDGPTEYRYYIEKEDIRAYRENLERWGNWFPKPRVDEDDDDGPVGPPQGILDILDGEKTEE
jgi:hypothetical protein